MIVIDEIAALNILMLAGVIAIAVCCGIFFGFWFWSKVRHKFRKLSMIIKPGKIERN